MHVTQTYRIVGGIFILHLEALVDTLDLTHNRALDRHLNQVKHEDLWCIGRELIDGHMCVHFL